MWTFYTINSWLGCNLYLLFSSYKDLKLHFNRLILSKPISKQFSKHRIFTVKSQCRCLWKAKCFTWKGLVVSGDFLSSNKIQPKLIGAHVTEQDAPNKSAMCETCRTLPSVKHKPCYPVCKPHFNCRVKINLEACCEIWRFCVHCYIFLWSWGVVNL